VYEHAAGLQEQLMLTAGDKTNTWVEALQTPSCDELAA